jgi:hypothetical protein
MVFTIPECDKIMNTFVAPWLKPPDFLGAAEAGARLGLSRQQMLQQAAQHAATLAAEGQKAAAAQSMEQSRMRQASDQAAAANALREQAIKQAGVLGQGRLDTEGAAIQQRGDAASAVNALRQQQMKTAQADKMQKFQNDYLLAEDKASAAKASPKADKSPYTAWERDKIYQTLMANPQNQTNLDVVLPKFRQYVSGGPPTAPASPTPAADALMAQPDTSGLPDFSGVPTPPTGGNKPLSPPAAHISALQANPALASFFDEKYGKGSSAQYLTNQPDNNQPDTPPDNNGQ